MKLEMVEAVAGIVLTVLPHRRTHPSSCPSTVSGISSTRIIFSSAALGMSSFRLAKMFSMLVSR